MSETDRTDNERMDSILRRAIDKATARAWEGTVSVTTEKFAEELAREAMNEPGFREQWRAWVREASQRMFESLNRPAPKRRRRRKES